MTLVGDFCKAEIFAKFHRPGLKLAAFMVFSKQLYIKTSNLPINVIRNVAAKKFFENSSIVTSTIAIYFYKALKHPLAKNMCAG